MLPRKRQNKKNALLVKELKSRSVPPRKKQKKKSELHAKKQEQKPRSRSDLQENVQEPRKKSLRQIKQLKTAEPNNDTC